MTSSDPGSPVSGVRRNFILGAVGSLFVVILAFVARTVLVRTAGIDSVSLNAVFLNFVALISVVEAGLLTASMFRLYSPLARNDWEEIWRWVHASGRLYRAAGVGIVVLGGLTAPFVPMVVSDLGLPLWEVIGLYFLAVANAVALCYRTEFKALLTADQKNYIVVSLQVAALFVQTSLQVFVLVRTGEFYLFLLLQLIGTLTWNIACRHVALRRYRASVPAMKKCADETTSLLNDLRNLILYKVGAIGLSGTDAILVAALVSAPLAGLLSNFTLVVNSVNSILMQAFNGIAASIGLHNVSSSAGERRRAFSVLSVFGNWMFGIASAVLLVTLQPFVAVWLGEEYVIDFISQIALVLTLFAIGTNQVASLYRTSLGIFRATRWVPLVALALKVILSLPLGLAFGMPGVLFSSALARLLTFSIIDPLLVYRRALGKGLVGYFLRAIVMLAGVAVVGSLGILLTDLTGTTGLLKVFVSLSLGLGLGFVILTPPAFFNPDVRQFFLRSVLKRKSQ